MMRCNKKEEIEYCDGTKWLTLMLVPPLGKSSLQPAASCQQIATRYKSSSYNGQYWIKPSPTDPSFQVGSNLISKFN